MKTMRLGVWAATLRVQSDGKCSRAEFSGRKYLGGARPSAEGCAGRGPATGSANAVRRRQDGPLNVPTDGGRVPENGITGPIRLLRKRAIQCRESCPVPPARRQPTTGTVRQANGEHCMVPVLD